MVEKVRKGGRIPDERRKRIEEELKRVILSGQATGVTMETLRKEVAPDVSRTSFNPIVKKIYKNIKPEDIKKAQTDFQVLFNRLFRLANKVINDCDFKDNFGNIIKSDNNLKLRAIKTTANLIRDQTEFMERFGIKEKLVEKHDINHSGGVDVGFMREIYEATKDQEEEDEE